MDTMRLDKFISNQTELSRSDVKIAIRKKSVTVNGNIVRSADFKIDADNDNVKIYGKQIIYQKYTYIMLNKPDGYVCSTKDGISPTVLQLLSDELKAKNLYPVGRLDKDTKGFVLLTNDGDFSHRILLPKRHIPKYYLVKLSENFRDEYIETFSKGITLSNGEQCLPARVEGFKSHADIAFIELFEGKYHQVKRMFAAVENHVECLFRTQLGGTILNENLRSGKYMEILHKDVENFEKTCDFKEIKSNSFVHFSSYLINNKL